MTDANRVLLYDPPWSPATEEQAIGRAHRIVSSMPENGLTNDEGSTPRSLCRSSYNGRHCGTKNSPDVSLSLVLVPNDRQQVKRELSEGSLGESSLGRPGRLSKEQVMTRLFGTVLGTGL